VAQVLYIGDEVTALGFRLAGVETRAVAAGDAAAALREALAGGYECVLFAGRLAPFVPDVVLGQALAAREPLFALVPDVLGRGAPADVAHAVRDALGIEA
jgi:vacuolar-type H+-ATPase subunit F/Vma7